MLKSWLGGIRMYIYMVSVSIKTQLEYRYAFVMNILGWAMTYAGTAITMWVLLYSFGDIKGWSFWQLLFLFALAVLSWGISVIFFYHFRELDQYIIQGTFDRFLVRPINPFVHYMSIKFDVGAFGQLLFSIIAVAIAYHQLGLDWTLRQWLVLAGALTGGTLIQGGLLVAVSALAFWTNRSEPFYWALVWPTKSLINYPLTVFPRFIQLFLTFIVPYAFVNYLPALFLLGKTEENISHWWGAFSAVAGIIFFTLCYKLWMKGLSQYKSAGS